LYRPVSNKIGQNFGKTPKNVFIVKSLVNNVDVSNTFHNFFKKKNKVIAFRVSVQNSKSGTLCKILKQIGHNIFEIMQFLFQICDKTQ